MDDLYPEIFWVAIPNPVDLEEFEEYVNMVRDLPKDDPRRIWAKIILNSIY